MRIYIDIDETICTSPNNRDYSEDTPIPKNIEMANKLYDKGHEITYWTARGACTGIDWGEVTEKQLDKWGCQRHGLKFGKPAYDLFIDDKVLNSRIWEKKGNGMAKKVMVHGKLGMDDEMPKEEMHRPRGIGQSPDDIYILKEKKFRWRFEATFPKDIVLKPHYVYVQNRPTLFVETSRDEDDSKLRGRQRWQPIRIYISNTDPDEELNASLSELFERMFGEKTQSEDIMGTVKLSLEDDSDAKEEWLLERAWLQEMNFDEDGYIELVVRYNNAKLVKHHPECIVK